MTGAVDRRQLIADAAIQVVAGGGIRALTHRAVDAAAELPTGTTSYQFRSRRELLHATVSRIAEVSATVTGPDRLGATGRLPSTRADRLAEAGRIAERASAVLQARVTTLRAVSIARFALQLEVAADVELSGVLNTGQQFEHWAVDGVRRIGARRPKRAGRHLVAFVDGLAYQHLVGNGSRGVPTLDLQSITLGLTAYLTGLIPD